MNPMKQTQESMLRESIKHFLTSYHNGSSDYSSFESIFFRLIQTMLDPPLEITWFYAAVTFHTAKRNNPPSRVLIAKDLLNLLISCSNLSSASKKIALFAPVVYDLYSIMCDTREAEMHERREVGKLVENMISYLMISSGAYDYGNEDIEGDNLVVCFEDLIRVWTTDRGGGSCNFVENLRMFFPLLSDEIWKTMNPGCGLRELVGIVLLEVFFLRLYMIFSSGMCADYALKDTRDQVVQTIKGFRNCHFLATMNMKAAAMNLMDDQNQLATYDDLLKTSIHHFLADYPESVSNLSSLFPLYQKLIQDLNDPPLEIVWFYSAVVFHSHRPNSLPPREKLLVVGGLLELVNGCASLCGLLRKVAVIAPVVYLLYHLEVNFSASDPSLTEGIAIVVEGIVCNIGICCSKYLDEGGHGSDTLGPYLLDLIRIWVVDEVRDSDHINILASFFPSLHNEFQQEVMCLGYLAGVVMNEIFLLRLCLKITPGIDKEELQKNMISVAIQTIKCFQNFYFLDMLLKMLSGPSLPVAASMSHEDAVLIWKVLYDATILVDYSSYSARWVESSASQLKKLALAWVIAADHAIQFARDATDQPRAISYLNAFRECQLVAELIKWIGNQAGVVDLNAIPDMTNPKALIKWLLVLDNQGIEVFDHSMSAIRAKAVACVSNEPPELTVHAGNLDESGECEETEMGGGSNTTAGRKRKEGLNGVQEPEVKQIKLDHMGTSVGDKFLSLSRDNLVIDIASDDEMDE